MTERDKQEKKKRKKREKTKGALVVDAHLLYPRPKSTIDRRPNSDPLGNARGGARCCIGVYTDSTVALSTHTPLPRRLINTHCGLLSITVLSSSKSN